MGWKYQNTQLYVHQLPQVVVAGQCEEYHQEAWF